VSGRFALILEPYGLEPREFGLLLRISLAQGSTQQAIGEMLGVPASRMVALIDSLEQRGLLERRLSPSDRRARALLEQATRAPADFERAITAELSGQQRTHLLEALDLIAQSLGVPPGVHGSQVVH
jgi:DNA-binding MarR family transcriptional regulator